MDRTLKSAFVCFCRNDPLNGNATDRCTAVEIGETIHLTGDAGLTWDENARMITLDGRTFPLLSDLSPWVGNWCWDGAWMSARTAAELMEYLRDEGWTIEEAETGLFDRWCNHEPVRDKVLALLTTYDESETFTEV